MNAKPTVSRDATSKVVTYDDGTFIRTAIVAGVGCASLDVLNSAGLRIAEINIILGQDGTLIVDTIDVDKVFAVRRALTFPNGQRQEIPAGSVVSADFRSAK
jgi:hypothetical protein